MKKFRFPFFLLALGMAVISAFAFNTKFVRNAKFDATYYYTGAANSLTDMQDPNKWALTGTACSSNQSPCTIDWVGNRAAFEIHVKAFPSIPQVKSECATLHN